MVLELLLEFVLENAKGKRVHLPPRRGNKRCIKLALKRGGLTHVTEEVDEWIHAGVAHRQPVGAEPDDVDVFEAAKIGNQLPFEYVH